MDNSSLASSAFVALRPLTSSVGNNYEFLPSVNRLSSLSIFVISLGIFLALTKSKIWLNKTGSPALSTYEKPLWYPHKDPILGLDVLFDLARAVYNHRFLEFTAEMISRFNGTITYLSLGRQAVYTVDPANLHAMLSDRIRFKDFGHGPTRRQSLQPLFGSGIFNSDGAVWKKHRSTLRPMLSRVRTIEVDIFESHLQSLMQSVPADGSTVDLQPVFNAMALDISTHLFLGTSTNVLPYLFNSDLRGMRGQRFATAFDYSQRAVSGIDDFSLSGLCWKLLFGDKKLDESLQTIHSFIDEIIEQASKNFLEESRLPEFSDDKGQIFFYKLLGEGRSKEDIKHDILNLLLAGKDSTASFLASIWYVLCQRPDVCDKIRAEISPLQGQRPQLEDLSKFPYLRMVLQEGKLEFPTSLEKLILRTPTVLRLYPPVAINQRTAEVDTFLPHGGGADGKSPLRVPRGASVGYSVYAMHRLPEFFGEDANEFRPERWLENRQKTAYMPFHAGPRTCLGQQLSMCLATYSTIRLLQYYERVENRNEKPWQEKLGLNCTSRHGVKVALVVSRHAR
ncbi:cytochrome P450 [Talaromyces proteolyticus]|uniref:Cytochrome P450 n=1 Tax=Talaromyces proteolyticus TaxID=1131652 RepID=A0AAD4KZU1_9EURO|nr:cytochrome P450 [Talaromyces proteolyticus]KAH8704943.1 cytochrome P450 [Talaromyces proteolyticus]